MTGSTSSGLLEEPRTSPFHGGNTSSNLVGDAILFNELRKPAESKKAIRVSFIQVSQVQ